MLSCITAGTMLFLVVAHDPDQGVRTTGSTWEVAFPVDKISSMARHDGHENPGDEYRVVVWGVAGFSTTFYLNKDDYPGWTVREFMETCNE